MKHIQDKPKSKYSSLLHQDSKILSAHYCFIIYSIIRVAKFQFVLQIYHHLIQQKLESPSRSEDQQGL
jgi:hypothetical protein